MAMTRRQFGRLLGGAAGTIAAGAGGWLASLTPTRFVRALRGRCFPGRVRALDEERMRRPGRWSG